MRSIFLTACGLAGLACLIGCGGASRDEPVGHDQLPLAHPGPWSIPDETLAIGDLQDVAFTGAGPWVGESGCSGGITSGTDILRDYLYAHFPQTYSIGGYSCRPIVGNESQMSVHATGRALDIMLPLDSGEADNDLGDPIGNWLIENAEAIGIQYIIWDLYTWMAARAVGAKGKDYGGSHPHHDHLHVELSEEMATQTTNWFESLVSPPAIEGCEPLPFEGGVIEETDACVMTFGPASYWRTVTDAGHDGALLWTNAFENDEPSNWARYHLVLSARGRYELEVYVDPAWGVHKQTRYVVQHSEGEDEVVVDQSSADGWVSLGEYELLAGAEEQHVSVYDNMPGPVEPEQHIAVDALRITRIGGYRPLPPGLGQPPSADEDEVAEGWVPVGEDGGCSAAPSPPASPRWAWGVVLAGWLAAARRRRRTRG